MTSSIGSWELVSKLRKLKEHVNELFETIA
jgi:hypothetical protein